jgi:hypothetical protein
MTAADLYDFETNIPFYVRPAFTSAGMVALILSDAPNFQKDRPRCELFYRHAGSITPPRIMLVNGLRVIAAHTGELDITAITDPSQPGKQTMAAYRAAIRQRMELDTLRAAVNLISSPYQIDFCSPAGSTETVKTDQGYELSRLTYHLQWSIKQDAFNQLAATP